MQKINEIRKRSYISLFFTFHYKCIISFIIKYLFILSFFMLQMHFFYDDGTK